MLTAILTGGFAKTRHAYLPALDACDTLMPLAHSLSALVPLALSGLVTRVLVLDGTAAMLSKTDNSGAHMPLPLHQLCEDCGAHCIAAPSLSKALLEARLLVKSPFSLLLRAGALCDTLMAEELEAFLHRTAFDQSSLAPGIIKAAPHGSGFWRFIDVRPLRSIPAGVLLPTPMLATAAANPAITLAKLAKTGNPHRFKHAIPCLGRAEAGF